MKPLSLDMNSFELHDWVAENGPVHVVFSANADNLESYPESGVQGLILAVRKDNPNEDGSIDCVKWDMDYTPFEVLNSLHESSNYYGHAPESTAYLKAYGTVFYKRKDHLYITPTEPLSNILQHVAPATTVAVTVDAVEQRFAELEKALGGFSI